MTTRFRTGAVRAIVGVVLAVGGLVGVTATDADAATGWITRTLDVYGGRSGNGAIVSTGIFNDVGWDTNGYNVNVTSSVKDTGRGDGQLAGVYARLWYTDGTNSGLKSVFETGREDVFVRGSRAFTPSKRVAGVQLIACRRGSTGVNTCGAWGPYYDNPYT